MRMRPQHEDEVGQPAGGRRGGVVPRRRASVETPPADGPADDGEITAVVFDIGGVLLDWQPRLLYDQLLDDPAELDWFLAEVCTHEWNLTLDAGRSFDEACGELAARHPDHAHLVHAWRRQDEMIAGEVAGVAELIDALDERVPRFLLTNMPADVFAARLERYEVLRRFHGAVVSGEEGVLKPSRAIFEILLTRFDLDPATTLFIDDAEVNAAGARAAGLHAHHFTDAARLATELRSRRLID
jgi:2-haloacid dehalogenase